MLADESRKNHAPLELLNTKYNIYITPDLLNLIHGWSEKVGEKIFYYLKFTDHNTYIIFTPSMLPTIIQAYEILPKTSIIPINIYSGFNNIMYTSSVDKKDNIDAKQILLLKLLTYTRLSLEDYKNIISTFSLKNKTNYVEFISILDNYYKISGFSNINFDLLKQLSSSNDKIDEKLLLSIFKIDISDYSPNIKTIILNYYNEQLF